MGILSIIADFCDNSNYWAVLLFHQLNFKDSVDLFEDLE